MNGNSREYDPMVSRSGRRAIHPRKPYHSPSRNADYGRAPASAPALFAMRAAHLLPASLILICRRADTGEVETPVTLKYPNGRALETCIGFKLKPGDQFELHGRTWKAVKDKRTRPREIRRILCVPADSSPASV